MVGQIKPVGCSNLLTPYIENKKNKTCPFFSKSKMSSLSYLVKKIVLNPYLGHFFIAFRERERQTDRQKEERETRDGPHNPLVMG